MTSTEKTGTALTYEELTASYESQKLTIRQFRADFERFEQKFRRLQMLVELLGNENLKLKEALELDTPDSAWKIL